ncbi:Protein SAAL1 [Apodemus speciosus]|uniref:Protein SAAL1 n=1 Tax=Apodemus speciosus TaxID=105296 RepID=A0ABQ0EYW0_APOSI
MDRNPSPPPPSCGQEDEEDLAGGDRIGSTVYSKHWLFGVLSGLIQTVTPESGPSGSDDEEEQVELAEEMENEICRVWDMSMDEDVALFLQEFKAPDIFMGVLAKSRCPRLRCMTSTRDWEMEVVSNLGAKPYVQQTVGQTFGVFGSMLFPPLEICVGILGNMACFREICVSISKSEDHGQVLLQCLCDSDPPTLLETCRLLLTCLSQTEVASVWVRRIREHPSVYANVCFIMSSSTNADLLVKVGEVVDKLFDLDEKLMLEWIRKGAARLPDQPQGDSEEQPVFSVVPCVLEAARQVRSDNLEGLGVYMRILQLLTTVDGGVQAIPDDPPVILQEQKTVLASVFSVLSAISASRAEQEHLQIEEGDLPLIDSLIRVLQNMEHCQKKPENHSESDTEEPTVCGSTQDDFHMKILKDISCEFLSSILQVLTKETVARGLKEGQLSKQKCSCAFQSLLPLYSPVVEDFVKVVREVDEALADDLEDSFPREKAQT